MTEQSSCVDCGFHHDPLTCPFRPDRKARLEREIREKRDELYDLRRYEAERREGKLAFEVNGFTGGSHRRLR